jgi:hypothetical protein
MRDQLPTRKVFGTFCVYTRASSSPHAKNFENANGPSTYYPDFSNMKKKKNADSNKSRPTFKVKTFHFLCFVLFRGMAVKVPVHDNKILYHRRLIKKNQSEVRYGGVATLREVLQILIILSLFLLANQEFLGPYQLFEICFYFLQ